jgi:DNA invertase Pin-like site-specific DNA recombinase
MSHLVNHDVFEAFSRFLCKISVQTYCAGSVIAASPFRLHSLDEEPPRPYARVSSDGQCLDAQREALAAAGATKVFAEKLSGASAANRKELAKVLAKLAPGDVLLVTRLDRLARSTRDLLNVLDRISKAGAGFRSLGDAWADTTTAHGRLMLTILGGLAEFERELIKIRTSEGRVRAKARGVHMGRRPALNQNQRREALARIEADDALTDIARTFGVSHTTIARLKAKAGL